MSELDQQRNQMRADLNRLVSFRRTNGEWTKADADEHGQAIRTALQSGHQPLINQWAAWLKTMAATYAGLAPVLPATLTHACTHCRHRAKPGRSDPGYCAQRTDQPPAYGAGHPLHQLPKDQGAACSHWNPA